MYTHFDVDAHELLMDQPEQCPFYPPLVLEGIAVTPGGQHHLVLRTPSARFYAGPDTATVTRRAQLLAAALRDGRPGLSVALADAAAAWVDLCWESVVDELVDAIAPRALGLL